MNDENSGKTHGTADDADLCATESACSNPTGKLCLICYRTIADDDHYAGFDCGGPICGSCDGSKK